MVYNICSMLPHCLAIVFSKFSLELYCVSSGTVIACLQLFSSLGSFSPDQKNKKDTFGSLGVSTGFFNTEPKDTKQKT